MPNVSLTACAPNISRAARASAGDSTSPPQSIRRSRKSSGPDAPAAGGVTSSAR